MYNNRTTIIRLKIDEIKVRIGMRQGWTISKVTQRKSTKEMGVRLNGEYLDQVQIVDDIFFFY